MKLLPTFRRFSDGTLILRYSAAAQALLVQSRRHLPGPHTCLPHAKLVEQARAKVVQSCGDVTDEKQVLGQHLVQFGAFRGQTFQWLLENGLGYVGYLVDEMRNEVQTPAPLSQNKFALKRYVEFFEEGRRVVEIKKKDRLDKAQHVTASSSTPSKPSTPLSSLLVGRKLSPAAVKSRLHTITSQQQKSGKLLFL